MLDENLSEKHNGQPVTWIRPLRRRIASPGTRGTYNYGTTAGQPIGSQRSIKRTTAMEFAVGNVGSEVWAKILLLPPAHAIWDNDDRSETDTLYGTGRHMTDSERLLRQREAAEFLGLSERFVRELAKHHGLPRVKFGRAVRYDINDLKAFVENKKKADSPTPSLSDSQFSQPS